MRHRGASLIGCVLFALLWVPGSAGAQTALERLEQRLFGGTDEGRAEAPRAAVAETPYLGFQGENEPGGGVRVVEVDRGGPAEAAGVRVGDIIERFDTSQVTDLDALSRSLAGTRPGQSAPLRIRRGGARVSTTMRVAARLVEPLAAGGGAAASLGVSVVAVTPAARTMYRLPVQDGALITAVRPGSAADRAGLRVGMVVIAVDGRRIERPEQLIAAVQAASVGQVMDFTAYERSQLVAKRATLQAAPADSAGNLESRFGDRGRRPVLGALGRLLDDVVRDGVAEGPGNASPGVEIEGPSIGPEPLPLPAPADRLELAPSGDAMLPALLRQIEALQATVRRLEARLERLERAAAPKTPAPSDLLPKPAEELPEPKPDGDE